MRTMHTSSCGLAPFRAPLRVALAALWLGCTVLLTPASANTQPELIVAASQTVNEGELLDLSGMDGAPPLGIFADPDLADMHEATVNWGDGTPTQMPTVFPVPGFSALGGSHYYADNSLHTVTVTVTDDADASDSGTFMVSVANVAPTLGLTPSPTSIGEGQSVSFDAAFSDPGFDNPLNSTTESFRYYLDWGDGRDTIATQGVADTNGGPGSPSTGMFSASHSYADDGTHTVTVRLADDDMGAYANSALFVTGTLGVDYVEHTFVASVGNVVPAFTVTATSPTSIDEGGTVTFDAPFSDPGFDNPLNPTTPPTGQQLSESFRYYLDWGDGLGTIATQDVPDTNGGPGVDSTGMFSGSHTYVDDGAYTVTVRLADDNMGAYANSALFVTGVPGSDYVEHTFTVAVSAIPEPAAIVLTMIGLACLVAQRRRQML